MAEFLFFFFMRANRIHLLTAVQLRMETQSQLQGSSKPNSNTVHKLFIQTFS